MNQELTQKEVKELYSQRAISIATYFGGPLAAGILARQNFINLGKKDQGNTALVIGVLSTLVLFSALFSIPEEILSKVPNFMIPFVYTGIIYLVIEKYQGAALKEHKDNNRPFYSAWKATGVGAVSLFILVIGIVGYAYLAPDDFDTQKYDSGLETFYNNEEKALHLFSLLETSNSDRIVEYIDKEAIPAWEENIEIMNSLDAIEGLYDEFKKQNEILRQYSQLRIETLNLIKQAVIEESNKYDQEIETLNLKIEEVLKKL